MQANNTLLDDISAEIGYSATQRLSAWFGGAFIHVPANDSPEHPIAKVIGPSAFRNLVKAFRGDTLYVPSDGEYVRSQRAQLAYILLVSGASLPEAGATLGVSTRQVINIRRKLEELGLLNPIFRPVSTVRNPTEAPC